MRQVFAHTAVLAAGPDLDLRVPGAAVTVELCGHWEHEPPCPLAPHHVSAEWADDEVQVRVLFVTEPAHEQDVRRRIERALAGGVELPGGIPTPWELVRDGVSELREDESAHAEALLRHDVGFLP